MRLKLSSVYITVLCLVFGSACATISYDIGVREGFASINADLQGAEYDVVGHFEYEMRALFAIAQLITLKDPELEAAISSSLNQYQADGVINIRIEEVTDMVDFLIQLVQSVVIGTSVFSTRHVKVTGDAIKLRPSSTWNVPPLDDQLRAAAEARFSSRSE